MDFKTFMEKCYMPLNYCRKNLQDYEIDFLFEKAKELEFDKLELARMIATIREGGFISRGKPIKVDGVVYESMSIASKVTNIPLPTLHFWKKKKYRVEEI